MEQAGHHMNDIRAILKLAGRRLEAASLLRCIQTAVIGLGILVIVLIAVDAMHRRAELGIAIGEKGDWGRGYGTDAIRVILRFAFDVLKLRRVELITDVDNERGIRAYEKCGFVREGVLRAKRLRYGEPLDMLIMAVLRED